MRIYHAAQVTLACTVFVDISRHKRPARLEILGRSRSSKRWLLIKTSLHRIKGSWEYPVRFKGYSDCVTVSSQEMEEMLKNISLVEGN